MVGGLHGANAMKKSINGYLLLPLLILALGIGLSACKQSRPAAGLMDSPEHHFRMGMEILDKADLTLDGLYGYGSRPIADKLADAEREFNLALGLKSDYGPALAGKGLLLACRGDEKESLKLIRKGQAESSGSVEKIWSYSSEIRAYIALTNLGKMSSTQMLMKSKEAFNAGKIFDTSDPAMYFYMGEANFIGLEFSDAEKMYAEVIKLKKGYVEIANNRWDTAQKVVRVAPQSVVGKKIALVHKISRADMAGLLIEELNVRKFYSRTQEPEVSTFASPGAKPAAGPAVMTDIAKHPLRADINMVVEYGVKGLQPFPDGTFKPQSYLSKAEVAMIYEDIIVRATGKQELATKFIGQDSPFPDVRSDHAYFNAVMLTSSRGILSSDLRTGVFKPLDPVSGIDALQSIKKLQEQLSVF